jgi:hypothetical protein
VKIAVAKLLSEFRVVETKGTKMECTPGNIFTLQFVGLRVKFEKREE